VGARRIFVIASLAATTLAVTVVAPAHAARRAYVAVQPIDGPPGGPQLRKVVVRTVRARGMRVTTEIPKAEGTGQYYTWARELGLKAFVSSELETLRGRRQRATFLVWSGHNGAIVGRWTVTAAAAQLPRAVARGFWPRLGPSLRRAQVPPEWRQISPGPTQRINAGLAQDEDIRAVHAGRRRTPLLLR
jgi:hypothetical protein